MTLQTIVPSQLPNPQRDAPCLFVPWSVVARSVGIPEVQAEPPSNLQSAISHAVELVLEHEQRLYPNPLWRARGHSWCFFHEYGRRVGMVPRSSLKKGKNNQMVEKGTKTPNQPKPNTKARRPKLHHLAVFPLHWVKRVKRRLVAINGPEFSREKGRQRKLCSWKAA